MWLAVALLLIGLAIVVLCGLVLYDWDVFNVEEESNQWDH